MQLERVRPRTTAISARAPVCGSHSQGRRLPTGKVAARSTARSRDAFARKKTSCAPARWWTKVTSGSGAATLHVGLETGPRRGREHPLQQRAAGVVGQDAARDVARERPAGQRRGDASGPARPGRDDAGERGADACVARLRVLQPRRARRRLADDHHAAAGLGEAPRSPPRSPARARRRPSARARRSCAGRSAGVRRPSSPRAARTRSRSRCRSPPAGTPARGGSGTRGAAPPGTAGREGRRAPTRRRAGRGGRRSPGTPTR